MLKWISKKRNQKGFTLIELVVVIAILGILAAVAIPRLTGAQARAAIAADKATFATLNSAIALNVAEGNIKNNVVVEIDGTTGAITAKDDNNNDILESGAAFKLDHNKELVDITWYVSDGKITEAPYIDDEGKISNEPAGTGGSGD